MPSKDFGKGYPMHLSREQKDKILDVARKHSYYDYMIFTVLATTGRRVGELYGIQEKKEIGRKILEEKKKIYYKGREILADRTIPRYKKINKWDGGVQIKDFDYEENTLRVWILKKGERIRQSTTLLTQETANIIQKYINKMRLRQDDYLFRKKGRSYRNIKNVIKKYGKLAGVPLIEEKDNKIYTLSVHSFRGYFITELLKKGYSYNKVAKLTGHASVKSLSSYDYTIPEDLKKEVMKDLESL